jgi:type VI secretion system protein ImpJ
LEASLPSRVIALSLEVQGANRWQVTLNDPRLREREGADFYLSVRSRLPAAQVQDQFPRLCKIGTPDEVDYLINAALDGVPLQSLSHVPAAIPLRLENQYFALDLGHSKGQAVLDEGVCAFYVPSSLVDVKLELFAVLRS